VIGEDYRALDGHFLRVLAIAHLPRFVAAASGVLAEKLALDVSLHVRPLAGAAAGALKLKRWKTSGTVGSKTISSPPPSSRSNN
jgi:hypothetical protein